jgi:hypothetical protein
METLMGISAIVGLAMEPFYAAGLLPYFAGIHIAELAGLSILFRVTLL